MLSGNTILILALLFYSIDFIAVLVRRSRFGFYSLIVAGLLSIFASISFSWFFITDNFVLKAVYEHSSRSLSPLLKLSASWTGSGGSLLLWSFMMTVAVLIFRLKKDCRDEDPSGVSYMAGRRDPNKRKSAIHSLVRRTRERKGQ